MPAAAAAVLLIVDAGCGHDDAVIWCDHGDRFYTLGNRGVTIARHDRTCEEQ